MSDDSVSDADVLNSGYVLRQSAAQQELADMKADMQRWAEINRVAIRAEVRAAVLHIIDNQRAAFISDEAFAQVRGEIEASGG